MGITSTIKITTEKEKPIEPYDKNKFRLGKLCLFKHEYASTGSSLRLRIKGAPCVECNKLRTANPKAFLQTYSKLYKIENKVKLAEQTKIYGKVYRENNKTRINAYYKEYYKTHPKPTIKDFTGKALEEFRQKERARNTRYRNKHIEEVRVKQNKIDKHRIDTLSDTYVKKLLRESVQTGNMSITPEMVELKREQLITTRCIRIIKNELNQG